MRTEEKLAAEMYPDREVKSFDNYWSRQSRSAERAAFLHGYRLGKAEAECLSDALEEIVRWADAYPLDIFPEPDLKRAREVLKAHGMTVDAISASAMRHVVAGVGKIARAALSERDA